MKKLVKTVVVIVLGILSFSCEKESIEIYEDAELSVQETELIYLAY